MGQNRILRVGLRGPWIYGQHENHSTNALQQDRAQLLSYLDFSQDTCRYHPSSRKIPQLERISDASHIPFDDHAKVDGR